MGKRGLPEIFAQLQEMRTQYALGYTPQNASKDGGFRKVEVKARDKNYKVQDEPAAPWAGS